MILIVAATQKEMQLLSGSLTDDCKYLVTGVGLVETTFNLTKYLAHHPEITSVINVGIAGGFESSSIAVLDCCVASSETIADLGICYDAGFESLNPEFISLENQYSCENPLYKKFLNWVKTCDLDVLTGGFLSVNSVSGTTKRGKIINSTNCICENMEGAAVARVCIGLGLDWLEVRVASNLVEDRDVSKWQIAPAIKKYSEIVNKFLQDN